MLIFIYKTMSSGPYLSPASVNTNASLSPPSNAALSPSTSSSSTNGQISPAYVATLSPPSAPYTMTSQAPPYHVTVMSPPVLCGSLSPDSSTIVSLTDDNTFLLPPSYTGKNFILRFCLKAFYIYNTT